MVEPNKNLPRILVDWPPQAEYKLPAKQRSSRWSVLLWSGVSIAAIYYLLKTIQVL